MLKFALYAHLKPKAGKEATVEAFLKSALPMAEGEKGTITWYAGNEETLHARPTNKLRHVSKNRNCQRPGRISGTNVPTFLATSAKPSGRTDQEKPNTNKIMKSIF